MKGGNLHKLRWRQITLPLIALLFTFVFLLIWEKNPFLTTFFSSQEQSTMIVSDIVLNSTNDHSVDVDNISTEHNEDGSFTFANENIEVNMQSSDAGLLNSTDRQSPLKNDNDLVKESSSEKEAECNYAKGRWVEDNRRPLYSGFECKQWLSQMWACRLTQRTDFSYEKYKWQPMNCSMPEFEGPAFLKRMQDKTLAFVGDSLGRQQFQSLMCMISGGKSHLKVQDVGKEYGLIKLHGAIRPDGWAYKFLITNTTILYYWSASLCAIQPIDSTNWAMHLDQPPAFLSRFLHRFDVLVLNTGHHWNRGKLNANRWIMYANGMPVGNRKLAQINNAKSLTIHSVIKWVDSQLVLYPNLKVFFRTLSPRHFFHGDWNTGGSCDSTSPLVRGSEVLKNESSDPIVEDAVRGTKVKILDISAISELRDEGHISRYSIKATQGMQDCLHWCLPGIPDTWNELLFAQL